MQDHHGNDLPGLFGAGQAGPDRRADPFARSLSPDAASAADLADRIERLGDRFERLEFSLLQAGPPRDEVAEMLAHLDDRMGRLERQLEAMAAARRIAPDAAPLAAALQALAADRDAARLLVTRQEDGVAEADRLVASLRLALADLPAHPADHGPAIVALRDAVDELPGALACRFQEVSRDINDLRGDIAALRERQGDAEPAWSAALASALSDMSAAALPALGDRVEAALGALSGRIDRLATRPDPVLDLTAQRQGFARFNAAAGIFLRRLEALVASLAGEYVRLAARIEEAAAPVQTIGDPEAATDAPPAALLTSLAALADANARLAALAQGAPADHDRRMDAALRTLRCDLAEALADAVRHAE
ncbi:hypothetical protein RISW2_01460 [Roseivivax isoporae LMG 25204]|uniref:Uncharacterized protein n=1 Tax=Roseivivax isoporae LMG 25204 TaxID=1449351 RepID=X7F983_9RHOB|nr:hypothetical protein RISW2_01460 [Roseivivax isoporae LMG 25204]